MIGVHIIHHILREIAEIYHVDFLKRIEHISGQSIAEAVLYYHKAAVVLHRGAHYGYLAVTAHECAVCIAATVLELMEILPRRGTALGHDAEILIQLISDIAGGVVDATRSVVHKVFRGILHGDIIGVAIHAAHISANDVSVITGEIPERHSRHAGKFLSSIVCSQRSPVVIGAQIDILVGMLSHDIIDIYRFHASGQMRIYILDGGMLGL